MGAKNTGGHAPSDVRRTTPVQPAPQEFLGRGDHLDALEAVRGLLEEADALEIDAPEQAPRAEAIRTNARVLAAYLRHIERAEDA